MSLASDSVSRMPRRISAWSSQRMTRITSVAPRCQTAALAHCVRARGSRPAGGHFLLLAQEKVTKEKSLKTDLTEQMARTHEHQLFDWNARWPRMRCFRGSQCCELNGCGSWFAAKSASQIGFQALCFGYFHLGQQMKVARRPGGTGGLSRSEQHRSQLPPSGWIVLAVELRCQLGFVRPRLAQRHRQQQRRAFGAAGNIDPAAGGAGALVQAAQPEAARLGEVFGFQAAPVVGDFE